ncbi:type IV pilus biogenesis/stability protein PilW [Mixta tenebrionis]|uniref:Type IV pilus biogenesis/stability protein PilW n=1 Tax=Mixta tenebrionis TaxID=2562439 RepID=A0A506V8S7_9GAMM|nr:MULTISPECIES: type IV pilus biogenesis/stability protein PilW [Mixta]QHM74572.1 Lipopolysaccharide assembly protein B [Mixta theicola]TPW42324.1 type IV pilus biogenesis/stability protein PilW [Mixta tenebrionis]
MRNGVQWLMLLCALTLSGCSVERQTSASAQIRLQLGLIYLSQGDLPAARRNLQRALQDAPQDYRVLLAMARLNQQEGQIVEARHYYQAALKKAPENSYALNNYGAFLCGLGQYDAAHQQFTLAAAPGSSVARADSQERAGYCYLQQGDYASARQTLLAALQIDRQKANTLLAEAEKHLEQQEPEPTRLLLEVYHHSAPATAESLWLEIRFAALEQRAVDEARYGQQLAQNFPQSIQYQHFLANEY